MKARRGIALVLALVVLLFIEGMAAGLLALSTQLRLIAASEVRSARARGTAELAVHSVLRAWETSRFDTLASGTTITASVGRDADASWSATVERMRGSFIIRGNALVGGGGAFATGRAAAVVRVLDRRTVMEELTAALASAGLTVIAGSSVLSATDGGLPANWHDSLCIALDSLPNPASLRTAGAPVLGEEVRVTGLVVVDSTLSASDSVALAGLRWSELQELAERVERGSISPAAVHDSISCRTGAPANWGDPARSTPCADYFPVIFAEGDFTVDGGSGQGILVVEGTVTFAAGAVFAGVVIARDGVIVQRGSRLYGAVRSGGVSLIDDAFLEYSRCALGRALDLTLAARRPVLQPRRFIPAF